MKRKDTKRARERIRNERRYPMGKAFVSALLTITLATMGVTPASIAFAVSSNANQPSAATAQNLANNANNASNSNSPAASADKGSVDSSDESDVRNPASDSNSNDSSSDYDEVTSNSGNYVQDSNAGQSASENDSSNDATASSSDESADVKSSQPSEKQVLRKTIESASGKTYTVEVAYDESAGIPENAELDVLEYVQEPDDPEWASKPENEGRPYDTELIISEDEMEDRATELVKGLDAKAKDGNYVYYTKFLAIDVVADGQSIQPASDVEVTIETDSVSPADACGLEVAEYSKVKNKDKWEYQPVAVDNITGDRSAWDKKRDADEKVARVRFKTDRFSDFGIAGVATVQATLHEADTFIDVYGPRSMSFVLDDEDAPNLAEGEELIDAFSARIDERPELEESCDQSFGATLWMDAAAEGEDAVAGYLVGEGSLERQLFAPEGTKQPVAFKDGDVVAMVLSADAPADSADNADNAETNANADDADAVDDGAQNGNAESNKASAKDALQSAKNAAAEKTTLTSSVSGRDNNIYMITVAYGPEAGIADGAQLNARELSEIEYPAYRKQAEKALGSDLPDFLRAFDISIADKLGHEIQPQAPVSVYITLADSLDVENANILHSDGKTAQVVDSKLNSLNHCDIVDFTAESFSVYLMAAQLKPGALSADSGKLKANGALKAASVEEGKLKKELVSFNGNLANYKITVNADKAQLNGGNVLTLKDTFGDWKDGVHNNQSVIYDTISIDNAGVSYDYSGYTGTFVIPDSTTVTITYTTRVAGATGTTVSFKNRAALGVTEGETFTELYSDEVDEPKTLSPTGTDISGTGGVYAIKLFAYPDAHMETGLAGAEFCLFDSNQRPVNYNAGPKAGQQVTFTTGSDGYADVSLTEEVDGVSIHKNTPYYLQMTKAPYVENGDGSYTYYTIDNTLYSFLITDNPSYQYGNVYSYFNGDTLKVRCNEDSGGVNVTKRFAGNYSLTPDQQANIEFILQKENTETGDWDEIERHSYSEFDHGSISFKAGRPGGAPLQRASTYRLIEEGADVAPAGVKWEDAYTVEYQEHDTPVEIDGNEFDVDADDPAYSFNITVTNEYIDHRLSIVKMNEFTGAVLPGTTFKVYEALHPETVVHEYTTGADGFINIHRGDETTYKSDTLYYVVETGAPDGYILPSNPEKVYFFFSDVSTATPDGLPEGATAVDLTESYNSMAISNYSEKVDVPVIATWWLNGSADWPSEVESVVVGLYQSIDKGDPEPVLDKSTGEPMTTTLTQSDPFNSTDFAGLDAQIEKEGVKHDVTYSVVQEHVYGSGGQELKANYAPSYSVSGSGWYVVKNQVATSVTLDKQWFDIEGHRVTDTSGKPDVTVDLYRTTTDKTGDLTRSELETHVGGADPAYSGIKLTADGGFTKTVDSLQAADDAGQPYYYFALERVLENQDDSYTVEPAGSNPRSLTVKNRQTPSTVTLLPQDDSKTYGDSDPDFVVNAEVAEEGSHVVVTGPDDSGNCVATVTDSSGATHTIDFTVSREKAGEADGENVGTYAITVSGSDSQHGYRVVYGKAATLTINPKTVTVTAGAEKLYGDPDPALESIAGLVGEDTISYQVSREDGEDVGDYNIMLSGETEQGNYHVEYVPGVLAITQAPVTVTANNMAKVYGAEDEEFTATVEGLKLGDSESVIDYTIARDPGEDVGTYAITPTGEKSQGNYDVAFVAGTLTISGHPLSVKVEDAEKAYGDADPQWVVTIEGLQGEDTEDVISYEITRAEGEELGAYPVTPAGEQVQGNYIVSYESGTLTIGRAPLVVTPDKIMKTAGDVEDPQLTATITGWKNGEDAIVPIVESERVESVVKWTYTYQSGSGSSAVTLLTFTLQREPGSDSGVYEIQAAGEEEQSHYSITYKTGTFGISDILDVDVIQTVEDFVDTQANPEYHYSAVLDLTGTGIDDYSENGFVHGRIDDFVLPDSAESNTKTLKVPAKSKLTVTQKTTNPDYTTTVTGGEGSSDSKCVVSNIQSYCAMGFKHTRISLPVQARAAVGQTEEGAQEVYPSGCIGIPNGDQAIDKPFAEDMQETKIRYQLPDDKYYQYNHASLYTAGGEAIGGATDVVAVRYDSASGKWQYKVRDGATFSNMDDGDQLALFYMPTYVCKVQGTKFYSLKSAMQHIKDNPGTFNKQGAIEMLIEDYPMPTSDELAVPAGYTVTLTTASDGDYEGESRPASIRRSLSYTEKAMITTQASSGATSAGNLTLASVKINGGNVSSTSAMIDSAGTLTVNADATLQNANGTNGGAVHVSGGTATINGTVTGNTATNGGAVYVSGGTATMGGTFTGNIATNGGAVYVSDGTATMSGTFTGNSATNGGVASVASGTLDIAGTINTNEATNGGVVFMTGGTAKVTGGAIGANTATSGGVFYLEGGAATVSGGNLSGNEADNGGLMYGTGGDFTISGGSVCANVATSGNGGAVYYNGPGVVSVSGGTISGNKAESGYGGAIYQAAGTVNLSGTLNNQNEAKDGAAIYVAAGIANFNGSNINGNVASEGGAVGVGSDTARLNFSGNAKIENNTLKNSSPAEQRNLYYSLDTDSVINTAGLGGSANIRIYFSDDVLDSRGDACQSFGSYTGKNNLNRFKNDRRTSLVACDYNNKIVWSKAISFEVLGLPSYASGFPPSASGATTLKSSTQYYPKSQRNSIDDLVTLLYTDVFKSSIPSDSGYSYAYTYAKNETAFSNYLTNLEWDTASQQWLFKHGDTPATNPQDTMRIFYSKNVNLSITNNSGHDLTINPLDVLRSALETDVVSGSYGYLIAKDYITEKTLHAITADDLVIQNGGSVKLMFPGGISADWSFDGVFADAADSDIKYTVTSSTTEQTLHTDASGGFSLNGSMLSEAGTTFEILFGDPTPICKVVDTNGEHPFATLNKANKFIKGEEQEGGHNYAPAGGDTTTATIEMLLDYQQPSTDILNIAQGYKITLTTAATSGCEYKYKGDDPTRATITRSSGDMGSAVVSEVGGWTDVYSTPTECPNSLTITNLIFDGKALGQSGNGGAIRTKNTTVSIDGCDFKGYTADRGGAIFVKWGNLRVENSDFTNCLTYGIDDKTGGGAIWTTAKELTVTGCDFNNCAAPYKDKGVAQGGAIFHNIRQNDVEIYKGGEKFPASFWHDSKTWIENCNYYDCYAAMGSGGTVESDAIDVTVKGCEFYRSSTRKQVGGNGGALNVYAGDLASIPSAPAGKRVILVVEDCWFEDCEAPNDNSKNTYGGAVRTTTLETVVRGTTFKNTFAKNSGGALGISNDNAASLEMYGCTFDNCWTDNECGAVRAPVNTLIIGNYTHLNEKGETVTDPTTFKNCHSAKWGGVHQTKSTAGTTATVSNTFFENCASTNERGGAFDTVAESLTMNTVTFTGCTASKNGGALYHAGTKAATSVANLTDCTFVKCSSNDMGGGAYLADAVATIANSKALGCSATNRGGGIYLSPVTGTSSITSSAFAGNSVSAADSYGGSIYINQNGATISGGSIGKDVEYEDKDGEKTTYSGSTANNGGGIYYKGSNNLKLTITGSCEISNCTAKTSGGGLYTISNTDLNDVTIESCKAGQSGGGIYHSGNLYLKAGEITECVANHGGGIDSAGYLEMAAGTGSVSITDCRARTVTVNDDGTAAEATGYSAGNQGGGIYKSAGNWNLNNSESAISGCSAYDGGAIYFNSASTNASNTAVGRIQGNTATNQGGAIYKAAGLLNVSGGTIGGSSANANEAAEGAGVFVADGQKISIFGSANITYNTATTAGGGVAVGGSNAALEFYGQPVVRYNTMPGKDSTVDCNVYLNYDTNNIIRTGSGNNKLGANAYIGVYASDDQDARHGQYGMPFGTHSTTDNLGRFFNDRRYSAGVKGTSNNQIVWASYVCKITDSSGDLLYTDRECTLPAVYALLENNGAATADSAFGTLSNTNIKLYNANAPEGVNDNCQIQMLVQDYPIKQQIKVTTKKTITLTTASTEPDELGFFYAGDSRHPEATVKRSANYGSMIQLEGGCKLTFTNIVVDGGYTDGYKSNSVGGIMLLKNAGATIDKGATLCNSCTTGTSGGAVRMEGNANNTLVMNDGVIRDCSISNSASNWGGAVSIKLGTFTMNGGTISGCTAKYGGAVRVDDKMYMNGGVITENNATVEGGGLSAGNSTSRVYFSGGPQVIGNTLNGTKRCNFQLGYDSNDVINAENLDGAEIGIYTDGQIYNKHGKQGDRFGKGPNSKNPSCFINDRHPELCGAMYSDNNLMCWVASFVLEVNTSVISDLAADHNTNFVYSVSLEDTTFNGTYGDMTFTNGVAPLSEKDKDILVASDLPDSLRDKQYTVTATVAPDKYKTTVKKNNDDPIESLTISGIFGENLDDTEDASVKSTVAYTHERHTSSLVITKAFEGDKDEHEGELFSFDVEFGDTSITKSYDTELENASGAKTQGTLGFADGKASFKLTDGESLTIKTLPTDLAYTIKENLSSSQKGRVKTEVRTDGGTRSESSTTTGTIADEPHTVDFYNTFIAIVCKVTNRSRVLLYRDGEGGELVPAVYSKLEDAFADLSNGLLKTKSGGSVSGTLRIEMITPSYAMTGSATLTKYAGSTMTENMAILTTALTSDEDGFPYNKGQDDHKGNIATVSRGYNGPSMIVDKSVLTLDRITLDGSNTGDTAYESTTKGGIIQVDNAVKLTVNGGAKLINSTVPNADGGAVWLAQGASLTMNGTIENCAATSGGAVYAAEGFDGITLAGKVADCSATTGNGGGICALASAKNITVSAAAELQGNEAAGNGGAIASAANVTVRGKIGGSQEGAGNKASGNGGGIFVDEGATASINSEASFQGNEAAHGGGLAVKGSATVYGGSFDGNKTSGTAGHGGAIYVMPDASLTISSNTAVAPSFTNNTAAQGGVLYDEGSATMSAGTMTGNSASDKGGAVYVAAGRSFTMSGGSITQNQSPEGAVSADNGAALTFSGNSVVSGNVGSDSTTVMNVYLGHDSNAIINTPGLGQNANIGVYVADGPDTATYNKHGIAARNFGTYTGSKPSSANLNKFVNDREDHGVTLTGVAGAKLSAGYSLMWEGKDLLIQVYKNGTQSKVSGASFTLANSESTQVWSGTSNSDGLIIIPWATREKAGNYTVVLSEDNNYVLAEQASNGDAVLPAGSWTMNLAQDNKVTWTTQSDPGNVNRTIDIASPQQESFIGETFILYNDTKPSITFDANGGKLAKTRGGADAETRTDTIAFTTKDVSHNYVVKEGNPSRGSYVFVGWNTKQDGTGIACGIDADITFYRDTTDEGTLTGSEKTFDANGSITLYAQWEPVICKITDRDDNLLYINGGPAVYMTLEDGFAALDHNKKFTLANGKTAKPRKLKMLVSAYTLPEGVTVARGTTITLTTAADSDDDGYPGVYEEGNPATVCTITRGDFDDASMITNLYNLTFTNITLDGNAGQHTISGNGGIVNVEQEYAVLTVGVGATLRNSAVTGNGGAVYAVPNTTVTVGDGVISGNTAAGNGGGLYIDGSDLTLRSGADILGNSAANGGGVFLNASELTLRNATIANNSAAQDGNGAGIYLSADSTLNIAGSPSFSNNTVVKTGYASKTNGWESYANGVVSEDIYFAEGGTEQAHDPASIVIAGDIIGDDGSISLWAANEWHYKQLMPFAQVADGVSFSDNNNPAVFRNAQDDDATENKTETYLYGTTTGDKEGYFFWSGISGSRKVILKKVNAGYNSLSGARFNVYLGSSTSPAVVRIDDDTTITLNDTNLVSDASGVFWAGTLSYGTYFMEETQAPAGYSPKWYYLIIDETGNYESAGYDTREAAAAAAQAKNDELRAARQGG